MKKTLITLSILFIFSVAVIPMPTSADTKAGLNPSHFFYFLDTGFEKINLFFTFNSEKKATKALEYAEERLAEAEEVADENETELVEKAMKGYEEKISLATEKSKEIKDEEKAEKSLQTVSESMAKHQIILEGVLEKVPQEAKETIEKAIETSQKAYEQAMRQMAELKRENEQLKKDIEELKLNDGENENEIKEISEKSEDEIKQAKYETETAQAQVEAEKYKLQAEQTKLEMEKLRQKTENQTQTQTATQTTEQKTSIFTLPNGAVIEMDEYGNIVKTIKEAPIKPSEPIQTQQTNQNQSQNNATELEIISVNVTTDITSAKIEWETNLPTTGKVFITGGVLSSKIFNSESGLSTRHIVSVSNLTSETSYSYEIESINDNNVKKESGNFTTIRKPVEEIKVLASWSSSGRHGFAESCKNPIITGIPKESKGAVSVENIEGLSEWGLGWIGVAESYIEEYNIRKLVFCNKGNQSLRDLSPQLKTSKKIGTGTSYVDIYINPVFLDDYTIEFTDINLIEAQSNVVMLVVDPRLWEIGKEIKIEVPDLQLSVNDEFKEIVVTNLPVPDSHSPTAIIKCEM